MDESYQQLTFAEKAIYHVRRAEYYQQKAEALEGIAAGRSHNEQMAANELAHSEDMAFLYRQATGNRNGHQQRAIMYGIAALVQAR